jgi:competence protein ComEC
MNELELILYNVGHGLAVSLIERPENYVTQIDLGSEGNFSPLEYLLSSRRLRTDILYITHPHADHLSDIRSVENSLLCPDYVHYIDFDWNDVLSRERSDSRWIIDEYLQFLRFTRKGLYAGNASLKYWYYQPEKAKEFFSESNYINNSSLFIVYTWRDFKISLCGDLEKQALESMINSSDPKEEARGTDILIAPHHGHKSGYTYKWIDVLGKPYITLISVQSRDPAIAPEYSTPEFSRGLSISGRTRHCLTTRADGTIVVKMWYGDNNKPKWSFDFE